MIYAISYGSYVTYEWDKIGKLSKEYCRLEMTFAAKCLEQWSRCYQDLQNINPGEDLLTFEQLVAPQRLMANLGYNRNEREQGLVSQLQNTSLTKARIQQMRKIYSLKYRL